VPRASTHTGLQAFHAACSSGLHSVLPYRLVS